MFFYVFPSSMVKWIWLQLAPAVYNMAVGREAILSLYRNLIRESKKWQSYNYRNYALRKVKHEFRENKNLNDPAKIDGIYNEGLENLAMIKRQVTIGNLYSTKPLIIENKSHSDKTTNPC